MRLLLLLPALLFCNDYILSYPRSGLNWTLVSLQALIKKPIAWCDEYQGPLGLNRLDLPLDYNQPTLFRSHHPLKAKIDPNNNRLILLLRNYKEAILSNNHSNIQTLLDAVELKNHHLKHYMSNIQAFDDWSNPKTKHLIYYEDLISNPKKTLQSLLNFLEKEADIDHFLNEQSKIHQKALTSYIHQHKKTNSSGGKTPIFHSKKLSNEQHQFIDSQVEKRFNHLSSRYLSRYIDPKALIN